MWGAHKSIYKFINELKSEQHIQELEMARIEAGAEPASRRPAYVQAEKKIIELVKKFHANIHDGSFMPYLKSIAHNVRI